MRRLESFLFFYSIVAVTVFFIAFGLFSPKPLNFISGVLMTPIIIYFWIRLTSPQAVNAEKWSFRFIASIVILCLLGIYGFRTAQLLNPSESEKSLKSQLAEAIKKNEELTEKLASPTPSPQPQDKTKGESIADLIIETPQSAVNIKISLKEHLFTSNVHLEKTLSSKKIGSLEPGIIYPTLEQSNGWYKIAVSPSQTGWVSQEDVVEVQY